MIRMTTLIKIELPEVPYSFGLSAERKELKKFAPIRIIEFYRFGFIS